MSVTSDRRRGSRMQQALLLVLAVVATSTLVGVSRLIWLDVSYGVIEPADQRLKSLAGTVAFLTAGGLFAAMVTWFARGHASFAPWTIWKRDLVDAAFGNGVAMIPGAWVLYIVMGEAAHAALALVTLVLLGTGLFWTALRI